MPFFDVFGFFDELLFGESKELLGPLVGHHCITFCVLDDDCNRYNPQQFLGEGTLATKLTFVHLLVGDIVDGEHDPVIVVLTVFDRSGVERKPPTTDIREVNLTLVIVHWFSRFGDLLPRPLVDRYRFVLFVEKYPRFGAVPLEFRLVHTQPVEQSLVDANELAVGRAHEDTDRDSLENLLGEITLLIQSLLVLSPFGHVASDLRESL
nr:hypothetical protein [Haloprofundus salilacus]